MREYLVLVLFSDIFKSSLSYGCCCNKVAVANATYVIFRPSPWNFQFLKPYLLSFLWLLMFYKLLGYRRQLAEKSINFVIQLKSRNLMVASCADKAETGL